MSPLTLGNTRVGVSARIHIVLRAVWCRGTIISFSFSGTSSNLPVIVPKPHPTSGPVGDFDGAARLRFVHGRDYTHTYTHARARARAHTHTHIYTHCDRICPVRDAAHSDYVVDVCVCVCVHRLAFNLFCKGGLAQVHMQVRFHSRLANVADPQPKHSLRRFVNRPRSLADCVNRPRTHILGWVGWNQPSIQLTSA